MRTLLLVSATAAEIAPLAQVLEQEFKKVDHRFEKNGLSIELCITGVGMVSMAFALGQLSNRKFDYVLNVGVAGSFGQFTNGSVVQVTSDCFSELGAQDDATFLPIDKMGFGKQQVVPELSFTLPKQLQLPTATGITVNTVHGHAKSIEDIVARVHPDVESMEGAAFFYACNQSNWNCAQIRAISNQVEKRDKSKWQMREAIGALNDYALKLLEAINY
jgi:futalosine hydrolase